MATDSLKVLVWIATRSWLCLNLTEGTVKVHVSSVLSKLGVADRLEAVARAAALGLLPPRG